MGETNFTTRVYRSLDITTAYRQAMAEARPESGLENGTIFTTTGVEQTVSSPMTPEGADLYARQMCGAGRKYGPALAIPALAPASSSSRR